MILRTTTRAFRAAQLQGRVSQNVTKRAARRTYATETTTTNANAGGLGPGFVGGLMGAGAVLVGGYTWYHFSGVKTAVQTAKAAKGYVDYGSEQLKAQLAAATPNSADDVISKLKEISMQYAGWVPGGKAFVDKSFKDLEAIQEKHGDEVNKIVKATYEELKEVSQKKGTSMETANDVWTILSRRFAELGSLAGDAAQQIMDNHPEVKKRVGGSIDQLKDLGDRYGPEAKQKVDETFSEVSSIAKNGFSADTADKIRKLVQEKVEEIKKMGEETWNKALEEQIKPALEKNPQVKKLVEENMDTLKNGNISEAVQKVTKAVSNGDTSELESWVKDSANKAQNFSSSTMTKWLSMIPGGSEIMPQLQKLRAIAEAKGPQAEQLTKDTVADLKKVLESRSKQAESLAQEAKNQAEK
ncbi:hypothetical protein TI39_contig5873g00004 [Zymoseptoria brevis]|uniref:Uncharacterized protein n=1 Tax=Zymoseptoria brevis TaxID=1047168 RepID=A0A0F4G5I0_9PEZI|nr:hypothetical protein TI39_contig5873g00004 [Zymoseptoria brevis]